MTNMSAAPPATTRLDEATLTALVHAFYARVRRDGELGPPFEAAIDDWPAHLDRMVDFWSTVMLDTRRFKGNVSARHQAMQGLTPALFARWLVLFGECARALCAPDDARALEKIAGRVARGLQIGLFGRAAVPTI